MSFSRKVYHIRVFFEEWFKFWQALIKQGEEGRLQQDVTTCLLLEEPGRSLRVQGYPCGRLNWNGRGHHIHSLRQFLLQYLSLNCTYLLISIYREGFILLLLYYYNYPIVSVQHEWRQLCGSHNEKLKKTMRPAHLSPYHSPYYPLVGRSRPIRLPSMGESSPTLCLYD